MVEGECVPIIVTLLVDNITLFLSGLFLKQKPLGRMFVALYSGFHFRAPEEVHLYKQSCGLNETKGEAERRHCSKYSLSTTYTNTSIEIPWEHDQPNSFQPTFGPKVRRFHTLISTKHICITKANLSKTVVPLYYKNQRVLKGLGRLN